MKKNSNFRVSSSLIIEYPNSRASQSSQEISIRTPNPKFFREFGMIQVSYPYLYLSRSCFNGIFSPLKPSAAANTRAGSPSTPTTGTETCTSVACRRTGTGAASTPTASTAAKTDPSKPLDPARNKWLTTRLTTVQLIAHHPLMISVDHFLTRACKKSTQKPSKNI